MIPKVLTQTGVGTSSPAVFNIFENPFNVGIGCVVTGTVNYTVQHTFDDIINIGAGACTWFNHDNADLVNATTNQNDNFAYPVRGAQVVVNSGTGSVAVTLIQAGLVR